MNVIEVKGLGKKYRIGKADKQADTLTGALINGLRSPWQNLRNIRNLSRLDRDEDSVAWALRDVSFEVKEGEVLGIIGHNGAGKSTLLKILSRITEPSEGEVRIHGRVAALLEVGTGFHPELTGRENIYMNGTILGMRKKEIDRKLDEIVDFSGVEKYLDTPVKFYSSGMRVRLGFSVAAHLEPEILIIDEVLAVGDAEFQRKCMGKMEFVSHQGRTVLFVSHNLEAIKNLCGKTLLLNNGQVTAIGHSKMVVGDYLAQYSRQGFATSEWAEADAPGNEVVKLKSVRVEFSGDALSIRTPFDIIFEFWNYQNEMSSNISLHLLTMSGETVFNVFSCLDPLPRLRKGLCIGRCSIPGNFLNAGVYSLKFFIVKNKSEAVFSLTDALRIEIFDDRTDIQWYGKIPGFIRPNFEFTLSNANATEAE
ncbi:MAG: ATP-binding cassette domain-containing protein [Cyclobacteriaceae bacterium]|nr:ATP-binding cassette domain-containing protein [Cyclobacteriaceae bacterium]